MIAGVQEKIFEYLYFGYAIKTANTQFVETCLESLQHGYAYTPADAGQLLDAVFDDVFLMIPRQGYVIIPLSGGLDSRILLGAVRERLDAREIKTVTFGAPGQFDYTIGQRVSRSLGVENFALDLSTVEIDWETLLVSVKEAPWTYVPDAYYNRLCLERSGLTNATVLSGFLGEALTGGHVSALSAPEKIYAEFSVGQRRSRSVDLTQDSFDPVASVHFVSSGVGIDLSELLDLSIRQANCIAPIVTPAQQWSEWDIRMGTITSCAASVMAPFVHPAWGAYWLRAPKKIKFDQILYKQLLQYKFPQLWKQPFKYSLGVHPDARFLQRLIKQKNYYQRKAAMRFPLLCNMPAAHLNYIDFAAAFRRRRDYQSLLSTAVDYLTENDVVPWLDMPALVSQHMAGICNHADALLVLTGLALNLRNLEKTAGSNV